MARRREDVRFPQLANLLFELAPAKSYQRLRTYLELKRRHGEVDFDDVQIAAEQFLAGLVDHRTKAADAAPSRSQRPPQTTRRRASTI